MSRKFNLPSSSSGNLSMQSAIEAQQQAGKKRKMDGLKKRLEKVKKEWQENKKKHPKDRGPKKPNLESVAEDEVTTTEFKKLNVGNVKIKTRRHKEMNPERSDNNQESGSMKDLQKFQINALEKKAADGVRQLIIKEAQNRYKDTPDEMKNFLLWSACSLKIEDIFIESLLKNGANPHNKDEGGMSALEVASESNNTRLVSVLQKYSKEPDTNPSTTSNQRNPLAQPSLQETSL